MTDFQLGQRVWVKAVVTFGVEYHSQTVQYRIMERFELDARKRGFIVQKTTRQTGQYIPGYGDESGHLKIEKVHKVYLVAMNLKKAPVIVLPDDLQDYFE